MYVPAHLCAHTPYTCRNATYTGTLTTRMCTGPHRSPGSCWQGRLPGWGREPDWWGPPLREEPRASHWTRSPPLPSAICPCPVSSAALGGRPRKPHPSLPPPPTAPALQPAGNRGVAPCSQPLLGPPQPTLRRPRASEAPQPLPEQPAVRQGALGCPARVFLEEALGHVGAPGGRGEVTPPSGAAGLCLCAHFGNCQFSSLANYLLGGGLKTVHTHKSPRDLNKRRWQVIFQHSPTLAQGAWSCRTTGGVRRK